MLLNASPCILSTAGSVIRTVKVQLMITEYPLRRNNSKLVLANHYVEFIKTKRWPGVAEPIAIHADRTVE